jgi:hypothetical protein
MSFFADKEVQPFLAAPRFYAAFPLEVPQAAPGQPASVVAARFADGSPALVERTCGAGTVLLFASAADKEWSNFPLRPAFLMIVRRAVQHAVLSRRLPPTVRVHDPITATLPARDAGQRLPLKDPRGGGMMLNATLSPDGRGASAELSDTPFAGFYQIGEGDASQRFAANGPRDESVLDALDREGVRARSGVDWQWIGAEGDVAAQIARSRVGREIWPVLIALAIACLGAEMWLAMRWAPRGA